LTEERQKLFAIIKVRTVDPALSELKMKIGLFARSTRSDILVAEVLRLGLDGRNLGNLFL
jgi:hypothetical protein